MRHVLCRAGIVDENVEPAPAVGIPDRAAKSGQIDTPLDGIRATAACVFRRRKRPCSGRLSGLWLFLIIKRKKRPRPARAETLARGRQSTSGSAVEESENIV